LLFFFTFQVAIPLGLTFKSVPPGDPIDELFRLYLFWVERCDRSLGKERFLYRKMNLPSFDLLQGFSPVWCELLLYR